VVAGREDGGIVKLPKLTRKQIYTAAQKGQAVEITWPVSGPEPRNGHKYTIQSGPGAGEDRLIVESQREIPEGWRVTVRLDADPVRLLGKSSGYATSPSGATQMRERAEDGTTVPEAEAVESTFQRLLSEEGRMKTVMQGAKQRQMAKALEKEEEVAAGRTKRGEKAKVRHLKSMKRSLDAAA
jgi:hypothetical protein